MKTIARLLWPVLALTVLASIGRADEATAPYDFRDTEAYRALAPADRDALEQVHRDFHLLWGALDRYADEHRGALPERLDGLAPRYLLRLPRDPFAKEGQDAGYVYRRGAPGNRAWCLASRGLPGFPYLAARGNVDLYVCKGIWLSGHNPVLGSLFDPEKPIDLEIRRQKTRSLNNLRMLATVLVERSLYRGFPRYNGKNFVLSLVATGIFDPSGGPENLRFFFSPGDPTLSAESVTEEAWLEVTSEALKAGVDFSRLTSYAGRRNADREYMLTPTKVRQVVPILADLSFPDVVLLAFSDGSAKEMTRAELGIAPGDEPIAVGEDAEVELLQGLSLE